MGHDHESMIRILQILLDIEDNTVLGTEELKAMDIAIQAVTVIMNRMYGKNKKINFDE